MKLAPPALGASAGLRLEVRADKQFTATTAPARVLLASQDTARPELSLSAELDNYMIVILINSKANAVIRFAAKASK